MLQSIGYKDDVKSHIPLQIQNVLILKDLSNLSTLFRIDSSPEEFWLCLPDNDYLHYLQQCSFLCSSVPILHATSTDFITAAINCPKSKPVLDTEFSLVESHLICKRFTAMQSLLKCLQVACGGELKAKRDFRRKLV